MRAEAMTDQPIGDLRPDAAKMWRVGLLVALIAAELGILSESPPHDFWYTCEAAVPAAVCLLFSLAFERAIFFLTVCLLLALAQPIIPRILFYGGQSNSRRWTWLLVQLAGFGLVLLPWTFTGIGASSRTLLFAFTIWLVGGLVAAVGAALTLASPNQWSRVARELGPLRLAILVAAIFSPEIVRLAQGVWFIEPLTRTTFQAVVATVDFFGMEATADPLHYLLSTKDFALSISPQCSGVEGFALVVLFLLCYFYIFAVDLRFPNVWVLLPISLSLSWLLNVVRISALFAIGARLSPTLAQNGFHSHAGWVLFSILALSIIGVSRTIPWFKRNSRSISNRLPITRDWTAARILPFAAFMCASLLLSTFSENPDLWYVIKLIAMLAALAFFLPLYATINWRFDFSAAIVGGAIGVIWIATAAAHNGGNDSLATALEALPAGLLATWILTRMLGTIIAVPMVEELFFRGYILERLDNGRLLMRIVALAVSTGLFSVFHERWILAGIAGLAYGLVYLRHRQLSDCISAHATSNLVIAFYALIVSDWSLI